MLEIASWNTYAPVMRNPSDRAAAPTKWLESLARSKAQIAAGQTVPLLPILDRLRASADRLEAAQDISPGEVKQTAG